MDTKQGFEPNKAVFRPHILVIKTIKDYFKLFVLMVGALVGVGFISGAEIYQFFARFKNGFIFGAITFFILLFVLISKVLNKNTHCKTHLKMSNLNKNHAKNTFYQKLRIKSFLQILSIVLVAGAMISGLRNLILNLLNNNYYLIFCICLTLVFFLLYFGVDQLVKFNCFVIFIVVVIVFIMTKSLAKNTTNLGEILGLNLGSYSFKNITMPLLFSGVYVFMNIVQIQPVCEAVGIRQNKKSNIIYSLVFSLIMTFIVCLFVLFLSNHEYLCEYDMPLLTFFKIKGNKFLLSLFSVGMFACLISTLLSCLLGIKQGLKSVFSSNLWQTFLAVVLALFVGMLDFSVFISIIYPVIGVINFIIFVFM